MNDTIVQIICTGLEICLAVAVCSALIWFSVALWTDIFRGKKWR
jgi:hypothetical protein